jgi:hypothetical protein
MRERVALLEEHFAAAEQAIAELQNQQLRLRHKIDWYHVELDDQPAS